MSTARATSAQAPGKLVLLGEYAVLEGGPAWVSAVERCVRAEARPGAARLRVFAPDQREIPLTYAAGRWTTAPGWEIAAAAITAAFGEGAGDISVDSRDFFVAGDNGPAKAGFGSSSAVVAALLALGKYAGASVDELYEAAREVHHIAQGRLGSGVDIAAAVFGGSFVFRNARREEALPIPADLAIIPVWLGASASTPLLVGRVLEWKTAARNEYEELMQAMTTTAGIGIEYIRQGDTGGFIDAAADYGRRMSQLGRSAGIPIYTTLMDDLAGLVSGRGAFKPSGAGGGDVGLVFTEAERAPDVRERIAKGGFQILDLRFGAPGARAAELQQ